MIKNRKIGFIGAGFMAQAMISGLLSSKTLKGENVYITNKSNIDKLKEIKDLWNVNTTTDKSFLVKETDIIVLAVRPGDVKEVLEEIKDFVSDSHLIITLAAGISISYIKNIVGNNISLIRAMPNTSCVVKESATALVVDKKVDSKYKDMADEIFSSIGKVVYVEEDELDAISGFSGSGPAYVYYMIEALEEAGTKIGLKKEMVRLLAGQTVLGAAKTFIETAEDPDKLREKVTTPGGITFEGISVLQERGFKEILVEAIIKAVERSKDLGEGI